MWNLFDVIPTTLNIIEERPTWGKIIELRRQSRDMLYEYWLNDSIYTFNWWLLVTTTIGIIIVWLFILDKKRIIEIITFGLMVATMGFIIDVVGTSFVLWSYPDRIFPVLPPIVEIHNGILPIAYMIVYQYFQAWKSYIIAMITIASFFAFVLEPLTESLGIYQAYQWKHIYSFPIYFIIGVLFKWIVSKFKKMDYHY